MLRSRVMLAVIGILLIGGTSAALAALTTNRPGITVPGTAQNNPTAPSGTATSTSDGTATPSPSPTLPPPTQPVPTATQPSAPPTATPRIAPPPGQSVDLHGTITAVNQNDQTFTYRDTTGAIWTVQADQNTLFQGAATSFAGLRAGMKAEVKGQTTGGFNLHATLVNSQRDD